MYDVEHRTSECGMILYDDDAHLLRSRIVVSVEIVEETVTQDDGETGLTVFGSDGRNIMLNSRYIYMYLFIIPLRTSCGSKLHPQTIKPSFIVEY
jgi:hypothetical protein